MWSGILTLVDTVQFYTWLSWKPATMSPSWPWLCARHITDHSSGGTSPDTAQKWQRGETRKVHAGPWPIWPQIHPLLTPCCAGICRWPLGLMSSSNRVWPKGDIDCGARGRRRLPLWPQEGRTVQAWHSSSLTSVGDPDLWAQMAPPLPFVPPAWSG